MDGLISKGVKIDPVKIDPVEIKHNKIKPINIDPIKVNVESPKVEMGKTKTSTGPAKLPKKPSVKTSTSGKSTITSGAKIPSSGSSVKSGGKTSRKPTPSVGTGGKQKSSGPKTEDIKQPKSSKPPKQQKTIPAWKLKRQQRRDELEELMEEIRGRLGSTPEAVRAITPTGPYKSPEDVLDDYKEAVRLGSKLSGKGTPRGYKAPTLNNPPGEGS